MAFWEGQTQQLTENMTLPEKEPSLNTFICSSTTSGLLPQETSHYKSTWKVENVLFINICLLVPPLETQGRPRHVEKMISASPTTGCIQGQ